MQKSDADALNNYWRQQPELQDSDFIAILSEETNKRQQDPTYRINIGVWTSKIDILRVNGFL